MARKKSPLAAMLAETLAGSGLEAHQKEFLPLVRTMLRLRLHPDPGEKAPLGSTRLGGSPDLPEGVGWPHHRFPQKEIDRALSSDQKGVEAAKRDGWLILRGRAWQTPLPFLGQLDLAGVRRLAPEATWLPEEGTLLFFLQQGTAAPHPLSQQGGLASAVIYNPEPAKSVRTPVPPGVRAQELEVQARPHTAELVPALAWIDPLDYTGPGPRPAQLARWQQLGVVMMGRPPHHEVLPSREDGSVGASPPPGTRGLLRVDSDDDLPSHFGDASFVTFCIGTEALRRRRFEEAFGEGWVG